ncbi:ATP-binding cassette domain-containing protein [Dongshaea marina]|uniref:ATP-binding cassette domain-containing protein n=1 Tax=Dongshaea marina TaxID=2047966 RepID=UPI000D3EC155|nr:ATP-binding cassette domain-containing protein [Dongshaea marina]
MIPKAPLLKVQGLTKSYKSRGRWLNHFTLRALDHVSFTLQPQRVLAVTGGSGSGKTTLLRLLAGIDTPDSGKIELCALPKMKELPPRHHCIRMIFTTQNHGLNPLLCVGKNLEQPLLHTNIESAEQRHQQILEALSLVELLPEHYDFYPHQLSLGERIRVAIARAIIVKPRLLLADDFLSHLDRTAQAQMVNLLLKLRLELKLGLIICFSDIDLIRHLSDQLLIMHQGRIIEKGSSQKILAKPKHPISQRLIDSFYNEFRL